MKRGNGPVRKTPLKRGKPPQRTTPLKSGGNRLEATVPLKPSRPKSVPKAVKELIKKRSGGLCEVGLVCGGRAAGVDPAHREGKGSGGTGKEWSNRPANLSWSCRDDHDLIDQKSPSGAERLGLKIRAGVARPWEIPVKHARLGWVLLDDQGGHRPAPAGSYEPGRRPTPVIACTAWDLISQKGAFAEAMERYGHIQCPGWSPPLAGLFTCRCGSSPFYLEQVA